MAKYFSVNECRGEVEVVREVPFEEWEMELNNIENEFHWKDVLIFNGEKYNILGVWEEGMYIEVRDNTSLDEVYNICENGEYINE